MELYKNKGYANVRLQGTIVRRKKIPVIVHEVRGDVVSALNMVTKEEEVFNYKELDITPVPLGYVNYNKHTFYLSRSPVRNDWRQGLRDRSMVWRYDSYNQYTQQYAKMTKLGKDFGVPVDCVAKTIMGEYPTFNKVLNTLKLLNKSNSMSFSRFFAVRGDSSLMYRTLKVGDIDEKGKIVLLDKFFYLKESVQEVLGDVL